jgi:hypothetical protein
MYEINTHNLKLYLLVTSVIFILTNGKPLLNMFNIIDDNYSYNDNNNNNNLRGDNFIIVNNNNYYNINATVVKHSMMYNTNTNYFTGSVMLKYINNIDIHHYCKIDIDIKEQKRNDIIYDFIYKYYNLSRNNIKLYCNNNKCIHKLYLYEESNTEYNGKYEDIVCNIIFNKQLNDEF